MVRHYELILYYALGFTPREAIDRFNVSTSQAYRAFHRFREGLRILRMDNKKAGRQAFSRKVYQILEKKAPEVIFVPVKVVPLREKKVNRLDELSDE